MGHEIEVGIQGVDTDANTRCSMKMAAANRWETQPCWCTYCLGQAEGQCSAAPCWLTQGGWPLHL